MYIHLTHNDLSYVIHNYIMYSTKSCNWWKAQIRSLYDNRDNNCIKTACQPCGVGITVFCYRSTNSYYSLNTEIENWTICSNTLTEMNFSNYWCTYTRPVKHTIAHVRVNTTYKYISCLKYNILSWYQDGIESYNNRIWSNLLTNEQITDLI